MNTPIVSHNNTIMEKISDFKKKGITVLENATESELSSMIKATNDYYYNNSGYASMIHSNKGTNSALLTDNEYDILKEFTEKKFPKNIAIQQIGAPVEKHKAVLPYEMASMDKIKPDTNALTNWMYTYNGPYVLSCKLDGVSGLYYTENNQSKLFTRGDGKIGQDISHLIPILHLPKVKGYAIRGEFIIPKKTFEEKYKNTFANARNLVSGIINSKTVDEKTKDLHFVVYEVIAPSLKPSEQLTQMKEWGFEVVLHKNSESLSNESLSECLLDWRKNVEYEIDGVIVTDDHIYPRVSGNPEHAFAFKMVLSDQMAEAKVVDVIWTPSKNGYLKPRVRIEPIRLGGVTIEYATGFNGKFIEDNKIGLGAVIQIIRSGDVIPYIRSVTTPSETAKMPDVPYIWSDKHVDIIIENVEEDITVRKKNTTQFFVSIGVDGLSTGNVNRLYDSGFDSVSKILKMDKKDFETVEGFKNKMSEKVYNSIQTKVKNASLLDIMVASNKLGRGLGERKMKPIMEAFPDILVSVDEPAVKINKLKTVNGIGSENAKEFVSNIPAFLAFLKECDLESKLTNSAKPNIEKESNETQTDLPQPLTDHPLYKKKIVMTKTRDKQVIELIEKYGASLEDSIKKDTFVLVVKSKEDTSNKMDFAVKNNIPIMTPDEFVEKYN